MPALEALEPRRVLNAGVPFSPAPSAAIVGATLMVDGTDGPDRIWIMPSQQPGTVRVFHDGALLGTYGPVAEIEVHGLDGDDTIVVGLGVTLPARLDGGAGNDRLRGGGGADIVLGGGGDDLLVGTPNRDALDSGTGSNRVVVPQSMGVIRVGPSVTTGEAIRDLSRSYSLQRLSPFAGATTGPIVVDRADLQDPRIVDLLRQTYEAGQTVALVDANADDAERLRGLLDHQGGTGWADENSQAALVAFRKTDLEGGRTHHSMDVVLPRQTDPNAIPLGAGSRASDEMVTEMMSGLFSATPVVPEAPPGDSPTNNLLNLADSYESSVVTTGGFGTQVQIANTVWAARSFENSKDLYYVLQEVDFHEDRIAGNYNYQRFPILAGWLQSWSNSASNSLTNVSTSPNEINLIQPGPQTTMEAKTVTSGVSESYGGSIGINMSQGLNALLSGGVTISNTESTVVPPVNINFNSNLESGQTQWSYSVNSPPLGKSETISFYNQWIWEVAFSAYSSNPTDLSFGSTAQLDTGYIVFLAVPGKPNISLPASVNSSVPLPFGQTFKLTPPTVTAANPTSVKAGDEFVITGTAMYPALITGVLIGGTPLPPSNYKAVSATELTIIAPDMPGEDLPVVVQTTKGNSNDNVTVTITSN